MAIFGSQKERTLVGIDIDSSSVAATEVRTNGTVEVIGHGVRPIDPGMFYEGEVGDPEGLGEALKELFAEYKLSKDVRLGIANQRIAVRTLLLPPINDPEELATAIRFQAQDHMPMPLEQAVLDWEVIGHTTGAEGDRQIEVVVVAGRRDMLGSMVEALDRAGLRATGIDLSAFGMIRALEGNSHRGAISDFVDAPASPYQQEAGVEAGGEAPPPARLFCNVGDVLNLAVAQGAICRFTRISPFGIEGIAQQLSERRQLTLEHARQWLVHVGLDKPIEEIDGDPEIISSAREVLLEGAARLVEELRLSLQFYSGQAGAVPVEGVVACGAGTVIPGLPEYLQENTGYAFEIGRPAALEQFGADAAARLTLSYGLALDG